MSVARDLRHTLRTLGNQPGFVAAVVATLAVAIGTNAAILEVVDRLMLAPPPGIADPASVVRLQVDASAGSGQSFRMSTFSYPVFSAIAREKKAFRDVAAERFDSMTVGPNESARSTAVLQTSGSFFTALRTTPLLGRFFGPSDDEIPLGNPVVVLSHRYWTSQFARDPSAIGRTLLISGDEFTIIGVAQPGFNGDQLEAVDLFIPLSAAMRASGFGWWTTPMNLVTISARLAPGVSQLAAEQAATNALRDDYSHGDLRQTARLESIVPGSSARQSTQGRISLWISAVSLIVLLIATANVGTLMLLRAARRQRDTAVRVVLGGSRGALARQLVMEGLCLALAGAVAGLVVARWIGDLIRATLLPNLAPSESVFDGRVLVASLVLGALCGIVASLAPMRLLWRRNLTDALRSGGEHGASSRLASQQLLVGVQVALSTALLVGAGLFVRSLERVQHQDLGFHADGIAFVTLEFRGEVRGRNRDDAYRELLGRVANVAGVRAATLVEAFPFGPHHIPPFAAPGYQQSTTLGGQLPFMYPATPEFLRMIGVSLVSGRLFNEGDTRSSPLVAVVNESLARTIWPGQSAIGKCIQTGYASGGGDPMAEVAQTPCREVVGVVKDSRARSLRTEGFEDRQMQYYIPFDQTPAPPAASFSLVNGLFVQATGDVDALRGRLQRAAQGGSRLAFVKVQPWQDFIDPQLRTWRLGASLFAIFGMLALLIAAVGLFGVISYAVSRRTRELGVRLAVGATGGELRLLIVRDSVRLVAVGLIAGLAASLAAAPWINDLLFQIVPWDPLNLLTAALVLLAVTVGASIPAALRASRVEPLKALRADG